MKKSNPFQPQIDAIVNAYAENEKRIRQDERLTTLAGLWKHIHLLDKRFVDLAKSLDELKTYIPKPPSASIVGGIQEAITKAYNETHTPKRKAVTATAEHVNAAWDILRNTDPKYSFLSAEKVAANWEVAGGKRIAGAALRELVLDGQATVKRGKYAQAAPQGATSDDHADSTTAD